MSNSSFYSNTGITSADVSSITSAKEAAATSETNAATSATNAATSSTNAATSATNAATSETNASNSAATATTSAANASTSETNASASAATATTQASNAATSATAAAGSASTAGTSATNAASSATNAATSETNAATSETNAANSATSAATSATNAGTSETNAAASASSASGYVTSATTQANNAATSATAAATSENNAASSATAASTSASGASTSASNANTSATNAASSASQAASSAAAAALAADNFDDTYLGSNASDPTTDNDGDALNAGDLHFNTSSNTLKVYNGSAWQDAAIDSSGFVQTTGDTMTGVLAFVSGQTFDGRDVSADGTKLDTIETNADVTDTANVTAAGALMDSELTNIAAVKALNQGLATTDEPSFDNTTLNAIAATISDTAVDVFVYDTRKDSDGGAWRKRTQHTSWYNEAASATRGSRKEFPAVAVIVAESNQVTIYDGDDPDMPMWIVICNNANFTGVINSVAALNGIVTIGRSNYVGCLTTNFLSEVIIGYHDNNSYYGKWGGSFRGYVSAASAIADGWSGSSDYSIVSRNVNDVAMTVLPNAPIDAATGLPVPTIAVATDGGVSVIKDDGTVVDSSATGSMDSVAFTEANTLFAMNGPTRLRVFNDYNSDGFTHASFASDFGTPVAPQNGVSPINGSDGNMVGEWGDNLLWGFDSGLSMILADYNALTSTSAIAYVTSTYNTGWQNGDIKLATLSDTDATNVTGSELVTNGTFDTDLTGWTEIEIGTGTASFSVSSGKAVINLGGSYDTGLSQSFTTVAGKTYVVRYDLDFTVNFNATNRLDWGVGTAFNSNAIASQTVTSAGVATLTFKATGTTTYLNIRSGSGSNTTGEYTLDNISVRLAEEDRSVNGNGLQVFGTVTKSAVASGADLVRIVGLIAVTILSSLTTVT